MGTMLPTLFALALCCVAAPAATDKPVSTNASADPAQRAEDLLRQMTLEEKIDYLGGVDGMFIRSMDRLGLPRIKMSDGPVGVRVWGKSTAYPAGICLAASWDPDLARRVGTALGRDSRARGVHILLGPAMNIHRNPRCGRNFEYLGEDPFLAGKLAAAEVRGLQAEGVLATVKHFAANNQEIDRDSVDAQVDERTLREIYLPAFRAAIVDGGARCVMDAYNKVNGLHCTQSPFLNLQVLRKEWGFTGIVMSDWGATHDGFAAAAGGLDLEMPDAAFMNRKRLLGDLQAGALAPAVIDDKVRHLLTTIIAAGFLDRPQERTDLPKDDPASVRTALEEARAGIVLLKNDGGVLPLDPANVRRIAVIGPDGHPAVWGGGGSSFTEPFRAVSVLDGLRQVPGLAVSYTRGELDLNALVKSSAYDGPVRTEAFDNPDLLGKAVHTGMVDRIALHPDRAPFPGMKRERFSVRWTARIHSDKGGPHLFAVSSDDGIRVWLDDKLILDDWNEHAEHMDTVTVPLMAGAHSTLRVEYFQAGGASEARFGWGPAVDVRREAMDAARQADAAVVCAGFDMKLEGEGWDRTYALPAGQAELIRAVTEANPRTIVVLFGGGGVDWTGWLDRVPAVLHAWYPGQEGGRAIADLLFGVANPAGRLPVSFERRPEDNPSAPFYLKASDESAGRAVYGEGIFVGYRGFDRAKVEPQFCFGHGLSYTTFAYADLEATPAAGREPVAVSFTVKNTGTRAGIETPQVYVSQRTPGVPRPPQELKGFTRVALKPGEARRVTITLDPDAFSYWHPDRKSWVVEPGWFDLLVGASSRDIRLRGAVARAEDPRNAP